MIDGELRLYVSSFGSGVFLSLAPDWGLDMGQKRSANEDRGETGRAFSLDIARKFTATVPLSYVSSSTMSCITSLWLATARLEVRGKNLTGSYDQFAAGVFIANKDAPMKLAPFYKDQYNGTLELQEF